MSLSQDISQTVLLFEQAKPLCRTQLLALQPRLNSSLCAFCKTNSAVDNLMLINMESVTSNLELLQQIVCHNLPELTTSQVIGANYKIGQRTTVTPAKSNFDNFAATQRCIAVDWIEQEQLFGCLRNYNDELVLEPGIIHQINGGVLIVHAQTLLIQPFLWFRLKNILLTKKYIWVSSDESRALPITIPAMDLDIKLIITGDTLSLDEFQQLEPYLFTQARYGEFENYYFCSQTTELVDWFSYIKGVVQYLQLPDLTPDCAPILLHAAQRHTQHRQLLPLSTNWFNKLLNYTRSYITHNTVSGEQLQHTLTQQHWHESYLQESLFREFDSNLLYIDTTGKVIGQINALSVVEYPGHPRPFGEPSRLSCVLCFGEGEFIDIERKVELGGNIHSKGMMIMQAYLSSQLQINHQLPFNASLVFEQSYSTVDGDSASLAGLCTLISALSNQPIDQQLAVTGSVDQFGNVQGIGGINEKIESFFTLCHKRGLTGKQGVIFPASNSINLVLNSEVLQAVQQEEFHLYPVSNVEEAVQLLIGLPFSSKTAPITLQMLIKKRIYQCLEQSDKQNTPWFRLMRWFTK